MLGKDIAANLREHREVWTQAYFLLPEAGGAKYCILGLKAHEAGIKDQTLMDVAYSEISRISEYPKVADVWQINDASNVVTVDDAIAAFDARGEEDFPGVEEFIEYCRTYEAEHPE